MQATSNDNILPPSHYDWSEFTRKDRGFLGNWCRKHQYANGEPFSYKTVYALIRGDYPGPPGPKIKMIIRAALSEALITETLLDEAA